MKVMANLDLGELKDLLAYHLMKAQMSKKLADTAMHLQRATAFCAEAEKLENKLWAEGEVIPE